MHLLRSRLDRRAAQSQTPSDVEPEARSRRGRRVVAGASMAAAALMFIPSGAALACIPRPSDCGNDCRGGIRVILPHRSGGSVHGGGGITVGGSGGPGIRVTVQIPGVHVPRGPKVEVPSRRPDCGTGRHRSPCKTPCPPKVHTPPTTTTHNPPVVVTTPPSSTPPTTTTTTPPPTTTTSKPPAAAQPPRHVTRCGDGTPAGPRGCDTVSTPPSFTG